MKIYIIGLLSGKSYNTAGGNMQVGDKIVFDRYEWRVLDIQNNTVLIITEDIVEQRAYHNVYKDTTWDDCEIRKYLNNEF